MKRQFLAAALALCLTLALLPVHALASTEYWVSMSAEEARTMLNAVAGKTESRYMVFVYYDAATAANPVESQFRRYANDKGYYIYGYHTGSGGSLADALAPLFDGNTALTLPVAVTYNPSTRTCMARDNVRTMIDSPASPGLNGLLTLMEANGLGHGSSAPESPGTPAPDPDPPSPPSPDAPGGSSVAGVSEQAWEVLRLLNIYRMEAGLQPLSTFAGVQEAANIRARELFIYCSHTRPNGEDYSTVFPEVGLRLGGSITSWAENIASGQRDAASVMDSWRRSPGHNANMLKPSGRVHVGIGYDYQTGGIPSLYASNWSQNFVAAYDCSFTNLQLSRYSIEGRQGAELEALLKEADIEVTAACYRHGTSSLPLIAAMCSGYDAAIPGAQELTVTYGGQTATLTVTGESHVHSWDEVTTAAACTEPGRKVRTCTQCGAVNEEAIPAAGHSFIPEEDGAYICGNCDAVIPMDWKVVYEALTDNAEENPLLYPHGVEGIDISAGEATVMDYLTARVEDILRNAGITNCTYDVLNGHFIDGHTRYEYRIRIRALDGQEPQALSFSAPRAAEASILDTQPLVLLLNFILGDDPPSREDTDVATPDGNVPEAVPPASPDPQPPSGSSELLFPAPPAGSTDLSAAPAYDISVPRPDGGQVTLSAGSASQGQRVTISVRPDSGYTLAALNVTDAGGREVELRDLGGSLYAFIMPDSKVTLTAAFEKIPPESERNPTPMPFTDVSAGDWFCGSVDFVWKHGLMSGVSDIQFLPGGTTSRAMLWTILARMHGVSTGTGAAWYEAGWLWAMEQGVTDGTDPTGSVTREQLAAMLWRDAGSPGSAAELRGFDDSGLVSGYAQAAMGWAVENGIIQGSGHMLHPKDTASRAETAAMLARYAARAG